MLTWEKVDAISGWFGFHSYALWRSLLDFQKAGNLRGDLFEIGVWRGRSASVLASYCRDDETLYLCDLQGRRGRRCARRSRASARRAATS